MDKLKGLSKGGWHPPGDPSISRKTWKSDLKGMATGKKHDPNEEKLNHESRPLASLRDPSSFGPPPKHSAYYGPDGASPTPSRSNTGLSSASSAVVRTGGGGGLGAPVPAPRPRLTQQEIEAEEAASKPPAGPYRRDTSGLRTDHLPPPPVRRSNTPGGSPGPPPPPRATPGLPARATPPPRAVAGRPPPVLPPRQNEYPDEHTPAPPPTYGEATQPQPQPHNSASLNQSAITRLGQAGVSVPGFGIRSNSNNNATPQAPPSNQGHPSQLNELQQRFSRLGTGSTQTPTSSQPQPSPVASWQQQRQQIQNNPILSYAGQQTGVLPPPEGSAAAAKKKPAPPPPPKKSTLQPNEGAGPAPPPIPMSSKPKFN